MDSEEIIKGNKLIADFMELKTSQYTRNGIRYLITDDERGDGFDFEHINYNDSWDWLIPVVENIENIESRGIYSVTIGWGISCDIVFKDEADTPIISINSDRAKTKLAAVWLAVVEFIRWHNIYKNR